MICFYCLCFFCTSNVLRRVSSKRYCTYFSPSSTMINYVFFVIFMIICFKVFVYGTLIFWLLWPLFLFCYNNVSKGTLLYQLSLKICIKCISLIFITNNKPTSRVGHRVLFCSECSVLFHSKKRMLHSFLFFSRVFWRLMRPKRILRSF